jgi:DNA-binding IclR family transcriptional regulator
MLGRLPPAQVRALFPSAASFVNRTGRGPADLPALRRLLTVERRRGWAVEDGHVTQGFASVAVAVLDHGLHPVAAISVTFRHECPAGAGNTPECGQDWPELADEVKRAAAELSTRIGGRPEPR